ncbi:MAG: FAD-binding protein [Deltaproteobacteria bacterium]|nr:FAD-binding protein [Deltaproteobacteria bacterium]
MKPETKDRLRAVVGEANFSDGLIDLVSYSSDASPHLHRPEAAIWATSTEQVQAIVQLANQEDFPVTVRGAGTGLSGLSVPAKGGLVMDLSRMDRILEVSITDRAAVVEPGVIYADLDNSLVPHGYFFPPDPGSSKVCTLGGNVATNAGGVKGAKYGTTRDYVLGLQVVLGDGSIMRTGNRAMKSVSGFDLVRLFVGSEGVLGIVTEITLKINPKPLATATTLAVFDNLEDAGRAVSGVMAGGVVPSVLEILGRETLKAINQNTELNLPEADAMLLAETDGYTQGEADYQMERVVEQFTAHHAREVKQAESAAQAAELWKARKSCVPVLARIRPSFILEDITVPISQVAPTLRGVQEIAARHQVQIATFGHAGDGNLHPQIIYDSADPDESERVEAAAHDLFQLAVDLGGTLTGEHGIGLSKAAYMEMEHDPVAMRLMRSIKKVCDPNNILNPGKMALDG